MATTTKTAPVTPGVNINSVPLSSVRSGAQTDPTGKIITGSTQTVFNPNQDLQRSELAYKATLPVITADKAKADLAVKQNVLNQTNQQLTTQAQKNAQVKAQQDAQAQADKRPPQMRF